MLEQLTISICKQANVANLLLLQILHSASHHVASNATTLQQKMASDRAPGIAGQLRPMDHIAIRSKR